jgi:uncharacterized membrane protein
MSTSFLCFKAFRRLCPSTKREPMHRNGKAGRFLLSHDDQFLHNMTLAENHPFSALTGQIEQLLWASIICSAAVATIALINMGRLSLFIAPIAFIFTLTHHSVLLTLLNKDRKKEPDALKGTLAPTAHKASIILCWLLAGLWCLVIVIVIIISVIIMGMNDYEGWERFAAYLEIPFQVAEICLLVVLAFKCRKQRRRTFIQPSVDWQNYQSTTAA